MSGGIFGEGLLIIGNCKSIVFFADFPLLSDFFTAGFFPLAVFGFGVGFLVAFLATGFFGLAMIFSFIGY
jgi:hypothetical protein